MKFNMTDRVDRFLSRSSIFFIFDLEVAMKQKPENCVRRLMGEGRETLRDDPNND